MIFCIPAVFGLCIGSFINALVWRIKEGKTLGGRSMCIHCHNTLSAQELVPVFSFLWLGGRCRHCKKKISWQYPIVEIVTAIMFVAVVVIRHGQLMETVIDCVIMGALIALFVSDFQYGVLPDALTLPAIAFVALERLASAHGSRDVLLDIVVGAAIGIFFFGFQWIVSKGKWIGDGDIRLGALMGSLLGFPGILLALLISYAIGSVVSIGLIVTKWKQWDSTIVLGPFLIIGTVIIYYGQNFILKVMGL